jgi:hypothetical protein
MVWQDARRSAQTGAEGGPKSGDPTKEKDETYGGLAGKKKLRTEKGKYAQRLKFNYLELPWPGWTGKY